MLEIGACSTSKGVAGVYPKNFHFLKVEGGMLVPECAVEKGVRQHCRGYA